ncbi:WYL domain-containing protein [Streptomyces sp. MB22_4]|uniref:WYL domain-containing protein n=1 Tax=Streptomyces sp. MB22_4 TaxID=3383120 RepID=UPI0039A23D63
MRHTNRETTTQTLTRLITALDKQQPVTITYLKADDSVTVRTIEIYDIVVSAAGDILLKAMDRETGEARTFRLDRLVSYTVHRTAYVISRPAADDKPAHTIYTLATTIAPNAAHMTTTTRINNLEAAFAA